VQTHLVYGQIEHVIGLGDEGAFPGKASKGGILPVLATEKELLDCIIKALRLVLRTMTERERKHERFSTAESERLYAFTAQCSDRHAVHHRPKQAFHLLRTETRCQHLERSSAAEAPIRSTQPLGPSSTWDTAISFRASNLATSTSDIAARDL